MYKQLQASTADAKRLRKAAGKWLQGLRKDAGLTQAELARAAGFDWPTAISQIETGVGRIPPDKLLVFAAAYKLDPHDFTKELLRYYDPFTHQALWGHEENDVPKPNRRTRGGDNKSTH